MSGDTCVVLTLRTSSRPFPKTSSCTVATGVLGQARAWTCVPQGRVVDLG
eukprot:CAMPEP_0194521002 /NCGR_PEP_ID=MMETSP0253-20130528/55191_1 /TAXON_ID=2966 /ORGANISM="Noctiluca scintillans" /LENGTH=49 /DNA_ID=CAMNT_0039365317 /DNA_START=407 /DNA_END=556 /DNA_ORIENTATION=-